MAADSQAVRRLARDLQQLERQRNSQFTVRPSSSSMLEWHFVLHGLPDDTAYRDGCYHGKLLFPPRYPLAPPSLTMVTPSGRLAVNQRLCLSMTDFHPESWNPAWTVESILVGLISFMVDDSESNSVGAVEASAKARRKFAQASVAFNRADPEFRELFPELLDGWPVAAATTAAAPAAPSAPAAPAAPAPPAALAARCAAAGLLAVACVTIGSDGSAIGVDSALGEAAGGEANAKAALGLDVASPHTMPQEDASEDASESAAAAACSVPALGNALPGSPQKEVDTAVTSETSSNRIECWICRDTEGSEPLIQPCACRGSMSGVHASCVEAWISHHRTNATGDGVPECSVCKQPYSGSERRPGPVGFAGHVCDGILRQVLRSAVLVVMLVAYWTAAQPHLMYVWAKVILFSIVGVYYFHKALVLSVSLPCGSLPPRNCCHHFFTKDIRHLAVLVTEMAATVFITLVWVIYDKLQYIYIFPVVAVGLIPSLALPLRMQGRPCSRRALEVGALIILTPFIIIVRIGEVIRSNPRRLFDPLDGLSHSFVPLVAIPLGWFCTSTTPLLVVLAVHTFILILGLVERRAVRKLQWKEGRIWWIFMQLTFLASYVANLLHKSEEGIQKDLSPKLVAGATVLWFCLASGLSVSVNWRLCLLQYRAWQHRNGSFTLSPTASETLASARGPGPEALGAAEPEAGQPPRDSAASASAGRAEAGHEDV